MTAPSPRFVHYEVVTVRETPATVEAAIAGKTGAVLGVSVPEIDGRPVSYALGGYDFDETIMVSEDELDSTGRFDRREDFYSGESIRVNQEGELLDE
ncbi:MAG: Imm31 family immunity protein [Acidimicrobiales bacterium]|nr:Imm31 family immunity protein [Acidimicrobiales bacterium]